jgi:hypothetical protein
MNLCGRAVTYGWSITITRSPGTPRIEYAELSSCRRVSPSPSAFPTTYQARTITSHCDITALTRRETQPRNLPSGRDERHQRRREEHDLIVWVCCQ